MTPRQRMLAAVRGQWADQVPFSCYPGIAPVSNDEVLNLIGRDRLGFLVWNSVHKGENKNVQYVREEFQQEGERRIKETLKTPVGEVSRFAHFDPTYGTQWAITQYVKEPKDYDVVEFYWKDIAFQPNYQPYVDVEKQYGEQGMQMCVVGRTPFQCLMIEWAGVENFSLHLADDPRRIERVMGLMAERMKECYQIAADSPAECITFPDNVTATVIGRERYEKYCMPIYQQAADILHPRGKRLFSHHDGTMRPILQSVGANALDVIEAFNPQPDGDVSVGEARAAWSNKTIWINFPSCVHIRKVDEIRAITMDMLRQVKPGNRFLIGVTENVPSWAWATSFKAIADCISEAGELPME